MTSSSDIQSWYDEFSKRQTKIGVNLRHYRIMDKLVKAGLRKNNSILEVGCGIGQLTSLLIKYCSSGQILSTDISDEGVRLARKNLGHTNRVDFMVTAMTDFSYEGTFDFIILPDVLEHIPVEQHRQLFATLVRHMHDYSVICIHIPHPKALDYHRIHKPQILQIIDQSLSARRLLEDAYANNLILMQYTPHAIFHKEDDYIFITFKKNTEVTMTSRSKREIIAEKMSARLRFLYRQST